MDTDADTDDISDDHYPNFWIIPELHPIRVPHFVAKKAYKSHNVNVFLTVIMIKSDFLSDMIIAPFNAFRIPRLLSK